MFLVLQIHRIESAWAALNYRAGSEVSILDKCTVSQPMPFPLPLSHRACDYGLCRGGCRRVFRRQPMTFRSDATI